MKCVEQRLAYHNSDPCGRVVVVGGGEKGD